MKKLFTPAVFVWGTLVFMLLLMAGVLWEYSCPIPYVDAWTVADDAVEPNLTLASLWELQNEHRFPIVRALAWGAYHVYGSMQPLSVLSVLVCGLTAAGMICTARRLRGKTVWTDAVFPILFLNGFHITNFLWTHQLFFVLAGCLACGCGQYLARKVESHRAWGAALAGGMLVILPLNGVMGLVFAPFLGVGFFLHGLMGLRKNRRSVAAWMNLIVPFLAAGVCLAYVTIDFPFLSGETGNAAIQASFSERFRAVLECAAIGFGALGNRIPAVVGFSFFGLSLATVAGLGVLGWKRKISRMEMLSYLLLVAVGWTLPMAIGIGRGALGGAAPRYAILAAPLIAFHLLIWTRFETFQKPVATFVQMLFFTFFASFVFYHLGMAVEQGKERAMRYQEFMNDIQAHLPLPAVAGRQWSYWCWQESSLTHFLEHMKSRNVAPFTQIPDAEEWNSEEIALSRHVWKSDAPVAIPILQLEKPRYVRAIRLHFELSVPDWRSDTRVYWRSGRDSLAFPRYQCNPIKSTPILCERQMTVWIDADVDRIEFVPTMEGSFELNLKRVEILSPPGLLLFESGV